jgi:hypothetical protein
VESLEEQDEPEDARYTDTKTAIGAENASAVAQMATPERFEVSRIRDEDTSDPCIAENRDPPKTPATPSMWNGCIRMVCSAWKTSMKLKVPRYSQQECYEARL